MSAGPRVVPTPRQSEADFQRAVIELAEWAGYIVNHTFAGRTSRGSYRTNTTVKGWPDLTFVGSSGQHFYAELKTDTGRLSSEQVMIHNVLRDAGQVVYVWRPRDWDAIVERLRA